MPIAKKHLHKPVSSLPNSGLMALSIESIRPSELRACSHSPRRYPKRVIEGHKRIISECGFLIPALVDERNVLIRGAELVEAARQLELDAVPVVRVSHLTDAQKRMLQIAYERLAELGEWDRDQLALEITFLSEIGLADLTGFTIPEIDLILEGHSERTQELGPEDEIIAPHQGLAVTEVGDLWIMGAHRMLCGDARSERDLKTLLAGERAQMLLTDPPYNVPIAGHVSGLGRVRHREFAMASGEMSDAEFTVFLQDFLQIAAKNLAEERLAMSSWIGGASFRRSRRPVQSALISSTCASGTRAMAAWARFTARNTSSSLF